MRYHDNRGITTKKNMIKPLTVCKLFTVDLQYANCLIAYIAGVFQCVIYLFGKVFVGCTYLELVKNILRHQ